MSDAPAESGATPPVARARGRGARAALFLAGLVLAQFLLYGPALLGRRILLPLDVLALPGVYLPEGDPRASLRPQNRMLSDLVLQFEPQRRFVGEELRAGRWPLWAPYQYAGAPIVWPRYSPFQLAGLLVASPVILAWQQLLTALVAGVGLYLFLRRALGLGFWAAAVAGWCFPLSGFLVLWLGFPTVGALPWLPWLLWAVERAATRGGAGPCAGLALATALVLVSGHIDVAAQVGLVAAPYALARLVAAAGAPLARRLLALAGGVALGLALAAPHLLPLVEYARSGARVVARAAGSEERPPIGLDALPELVLPDFHGSDASDSLRTRAYNQLEGPPAGHAGLLATLVLAPLAWADRRRRGQVLLFGALALLGLGWCLALPGWVWLLRLPGLDLLSHNRLVFASGFALLVLAALGLEALARGALARRPWFLLPALLVLALGVVSARRAVQPPEPFASELAADVLQGGARFGVETPTRARELRAHFTRSAAEGAGLCALALAAWLGLAWRPRAGAARVLGALAVAELLWFAHGRNPQCARELDYPRLPVLEALARAEPGRVLGYECLPANLAQTHGLWDVRGYDAIDPALYLELLATGSAAGEDGTRYASTLLFTPRGELEPPDGVRLAPVLDLLAVRYLVFRGPPPPGTRPLHVGPDYLAFVNRSALPRASVPRRVETVADGEARLARIGAAGFDPRALALVEQPVALPEECRGTARIVAETPTRVELALTLETPALVRLADRFDPGWEARLDGVQVQILRTDHALRGVLAGPEARTLEFRYAPASLRRGLWLAGLGLLGLAALGLTARRATARGVQV